MVTKITKEKISRFCKETEKSPSEVKYTIFQTFANVIIILTGCNKWLGGFQLTTYSVIDKNKFHWL